MFSVRRLLVILSCCSVLVFVSSCLTLDYSPRQTAAPQYTRGGGVCSSAELKYISDLVHSKVNTERRRAGLTTLSPDSGLAMVATSHSSDMIRRKFFAHVNPDGEDAVARAERMGVPSYSVRGLYKIGVGENVGLLSRGNLKGYGEIRTSEDIAAVMMDIWMKSRGHRENILSPDYGLLGVGVVCDSEGTYYFTQNFR